MKQPPIADISFGKEMIVGAHASLFLVEILDVTCPQYRHPGFALAGLNNVSLADFIICIGKEVGAHADLCFLFS